MAYNVHLRAEPVPDDVAVMLRAGIRGLELDKLASDAARSARTIGILGISVVAALAGESLQEAWSRSPVTAEREVVWRSTAGLLRDAGFPLLATGRDVRHFTVVLERLDTQLLTHLASQFIKEERE